MQTTIVNLRNTNRFDCKIDRTSIFGNPHNIGFCKICNALHDRKQCIEEYKKYFDKRILTDDCFRDSILSLKGRVLACWCKPLMCHGDVIIEYLEGIPYGNKQINVETINFFD